MLAARNLRPQGLSHRLATPSKCWNSARLAIAASPEPAQEEKGRSTVIQEWWFLIPAALFGSAAWNFLRARAKEKVRNCRESRLKMEGIEGNQIYDVCSTESLDSLEFRKVVCKGVYDENNSILVHKYLRIKSGNWMNGYNLLTPLNPIPGDPQSIQSPILVNRGWVPLSWGNKALGVESNSSRLPPTPVEFVGVISKGERPNKLWRSNNPAKFEWFTADVPSIARACGLPETTLHVVEIDVSSNINTRKPPPFAFLSREVKGIYLSQLEHERYSSLGFFGGCAAMAKGLKKFGKL
ncbi:hypothetical protein C2S53_020060 [Perilla frutescens var. hirtella]|uniref:SURF1-like protein n=1 Tax=Perilla frutescens var. hirtella TaxID=608512 RepID=A0AAD4JL32_PERFH|nr:hypothetical protein C2S53_020060 [Perilla frutescens var. hirtella]